MRKVAMLAAIGLAASAGAAAAQSSDARFQREVLERLDRIERLLVRQGQGQGPVTTPEPVQPASALPVPAGARPDMGTETNLRCGFAGADCVAQAAAYCRRAGYGHGVPSRIETRGELAFLVRVTCVE